jgi:uncharacterized protein
MNASIEKHEFIIDKQTKHAIKVFLGMIAASYSIHKSILFGSRARHTHSIESDADIAIILNGEKGQRSSVAMDMAGISFRAMLQTGILVDALPLWQTEMEHPELFSNPELIENIQREGVWL